MDQILEGFVARSRFPLHWGEMDAFQHMNNVAFIRHFESSRILYFENLQNMNVSGNNVGPILASISCQYRFPLTYPDVLITGSRISRLDEDRFTLEHHLYSQNQHGVAAKGYSVIVPYHYETKKKAAMPESWIESFEQLEGLGRKQWYAS